MPPWPPRQKPRARSFCKARRVAPASRARRGSASWVEAARARQPQAIALAVVDCADAPGLALGALRDGAEAVRLSGVDDRALSAVTDIAEQLGARVDDGPEKPLLDLMNEHDPLAACRRFLASGLE